MTRPFLALIMLPAVIAGCVTTDPMPVQKSAAEHQESLGSAQERKLTLGVVQSGIHEGMPQADVAALLGSPNIVTPDADGIETWIYDKVATESTYSNSQRSQSAAAGTSATVGGGVLGSVFGGMAGVLGGVVGGGQMQAAGASDGAGATSRTQRTLTVVIKFDKRHTVKSVRSQMSSF